jgi:hypothetical protein
MAATPASEKTIYFDAPIIHFQKSQSPPSPMMELNPLAQLPPKQASHPADEKDQQGVEVAPKDDPITEPVPTKTSQDGDVRRDPLLTSSLLPTGSSSAPIGSQPRSMFTKADVQPVNGSTFIGGAATTGPNSTAEVNNDLHRRAASADASLTASKDRR